MVLSEINNAILELEFLSDKKGRLKLSNATNQSNSFLVGATPVPRKYASSEYVTKFLYCIFSTPAPVIMEVGI